MNKFVAILSCLLFTVGTSYSQVVQVATGSVQDYFIGSHAEFYNVFRSKVNYPYSLRADKVTGIVFFELEIDTTGHIILAKILRGVHPLLDQEVENKIWLTDGKWKPFVDNGRKINYRIIDNVYFELR